MVTTLERPSVDQLMQWLEAVPDPEIPVISVVDLGIVRDVNWDGDTCVVTITPTYSGCPAMHDIATGVVQELNARGVEQVRIKTQLAPAWTTDWMSEKGRAALNGYGIAPPREKAVDLTSIFAQRDMPAVPCPLCTSTHTRLISQFGSTPCKALYRCQACGEPFDYFKPH